MNAGDLERYVGVIRSARIYFYHHSVGQNVLDGMKQLSGASAIRMVDVDDAASIAGPALVHGGGGRNGNPKGKIDFFASMLRNDAAVRPELALLKLCYADIGPQTDIDDLFTHYRRTLAVLKQEFPGIRFAHVTVPLMRSPTGIKASVFRLIGREVWADASNLKRVEFNRRLREAFPNDPIFDLAQVQATSPDGRASTFEYERREYPSLYPGYATPDGGHLNALGQRAAGAAALRFFAGALALHDAQ